MTTIKKTDFLAKVKKQAAEALTKANTDGNTTLSTAEEARLPAYVKDDVKAYRAAKGAVKVSAFKTAFAAEAKARADAVDNGDGMLTDAEQARLPSALKNNLVALGAISGPVTLPPSSSSRGVFGISGTVPSGRVEIRALINQGLKNPSAVAVNQRDNTVWVVNRGDDSSVVLKPDGTVTRYQDDSAHFMNNPMAIAFSKTRNEFATVQETNNDYNGHQHGNDFMGPTLWTASLNDFEGGTNSHLDMLHHSPNAMGIAAGADGTKREYWVFNGQAGSVDRYLYNQPHALGGDDHRDGTTTRYVAGQLKRVAGVPSHMVLDGPSGKLFIADTGNGRVVVLETKTASTQGTQISAHHDETPLFSNPTPQLKSVVGQGSLQRPSGMLLKDGHLLVGDYATGHIKVFSLTGELEGDLNTGLGTSTLTGLVEINGKLAALDSRKNRLVEISVRP